MAKIMKTDWYFIIPASMIFFSSLIITFRDFVQIQETNYRLGFVTVGLGLFITGLALRITAKRTLGKYYTYVLRTGRRTKLIKYGIYEHVRHPIYLAVLVYTPAIPLLFSSLCGFLIMLGLIPCVLYRIEIEERMLFEEFGDEYRDYVQNSERLIPHIY